MQGAKLSYRIPEAVHLTGISRSALYLAIKEKRLVARKHGKTTIILSDELDRYLKSLQEAA